MVGRKGMKWEKTAVKEAMKDVYKYAKERLPSPLELRDDTLRRLVNQVRHDLISYSIILSSRDWRERIENYEIVLFKEVKNELGNLEKHED